MLTVDLDRLHQIAVECGAVVMGERPHYLMTAEQLAAIVSKAQEPQPAIIPPPPC